MFDNNRFLLKHKELISYVAVGISAVAMNWLTYSLLVVFMPMVAANTLSWAITMVFTFLTNKIYVFQSRCFERNILKKEIISFFTTRGITGVLEVVAQPQLYAWGMNRPLFGVEGLEAKVTVCIVLSIVNYLSTKLIVFPTSNSKRMESA